MATPQVARSNEVAQRNKSLRRTREPDGEELAIARVPNTSGPRLANAAFSLRHLRRRRLVSLETGKQRWGEMCFSHHSPCFPGSIHSIKALKPSKAI